MFNLLTTVAHGAHNTLRRSLSTAARKPTSYVGNSKAEINSKLLALRKHIPLYGRLELGFPLDDNTYDVNITNTLQKPRFDFHKLDLKPSFLNELNKELIRFKPEPCSAYRTIKISVNNEKEFLKASEIVGKCVRDNWLYTN